MSGAHTATAAGTSRPGGMEGPDDCLDEEDRLAVEQLFLSLAGKQK